MIMMNIMTKFLIMILVFEATDDWSCWEGFPVQGSEASLVTWHWLTHYEKTVLERVTNERNSGVVVTEVTDHTLPIQEFSRVWSQLRPNEYQQGLFWDAYRFDRSKCCSPSSIEVF